MPQTSALSYFYPEVGAGGFSHTSSTADFFLRVNALLGPDMTVLDFGAGRGEAGDRSETFLFKLRNLKGKVRRLVGVDVDPVVLTNPLLDESRVISIGGALPFEDSSFDMILCDFVFEHIRDTGQVVAELDRVLKPGGWLCARTPNKWGYIALAASLTPEWFHSAVLSRVQPARKECDVFPKYYRMNTVRQIANLFSAGRYENFTYATNPEPAYAGDSRLLWRLFLLWYRLAPRPFKTVLHIFLRKPLKPVATPSKPPLKRHAAVS